MCGVFSIALVAVIFKLRAVESMTNNVIRSWCRMDTLINRLVDKILQLEDADLYGLALGRPSKKPRMTRHERFRRRSLGEDNFDTLLSAKLAVKNDASFVRMFVVEAMKAIANTTRLLGDRMFVPLSLLVQVAATGELTQSQWKQALSNVSESNLTCDYAVQHPVASIGGLMKALLSFVPKDAYAQRLQRAFDDVLRAAESGSITVSDKTSAFVYLLGGTARLPRNSSCILETRLLSEIVAVAQPPLGIIGLVQKPVLTSCADHVWKTFTCDAEVNAPFKPSLLSASACRAQAVFLAAADLARRGKHEGSKHGCVLIDGNLQEFDGNMVDEADASRSLLEETSKTPLRILGEGWNHCLFDGTTPRIIHAEVHAMADAIRKLGEETAFAAFREATACIVELNENVGYDDAQPCPTCNTVLLACGVSAVVYSTRDGALRSLELGPRRPHLLASRGCITLVWACKELGVHCNRVEQAFFTGVVEAT